MVNNLVTTAINVLTDRASGLIEQARDLNSHKDDPGLKQAAKAMRASARLMLAACTCLTRAIEDNVSIVRVGAFWRIPSERDASRFYMASDSVCACEAGCNGRACKHTYAANALTDAANSSSHASTTTTEREAVYDSAAVSVNAAIAVIDTVAGGSGVDGFPEGPASPWQSWYWNE
jgi:hypothetical protein